MALGEAARERETGVAFLVDEVQFLRAAEFEALIAGLHRTVQRQLPITLVGAGLPQLPRLAGEAKSYAERLFKFPRIGRLSPPQAEAALAEPAADLGVTLRAGRDRRDRRLHRGLPVLHPGVRQDRLGPGARRATTIGRRVVEEARRAVEAKLDESFFRVRAERTTELELRYLRAIAELGPGDHAAGDVAALLGRTSEQLGPTRARLIDKGLVYTTATAAATSRCRSSTATCAETTSCAPVRIIAGSRKGHRIAAPKGETTRPTGDRVREAAFNLIGPVDGAAVLDLFAGSGAMGLEALSRGAARADVRRVRPRRLPHDRREPRQAAADGARVLCQDVLRFLRGRAAALRPDPRRPALRSG